MSNVRKLGFKSSDCLALLGGRARRAEAGRHPKCIALQPLLADSGAVARYRGVRQALLVTGLGKVCWALIAAQIVFARDPLAPRWRVAVRRFLDARAYYCTTRTREMILIRQSNCSDSSVCAAQGFRGDSPNNLLYCSAK